MKSLPIRIIFLIFLFWTVRVEADGKIYIYPLKNINITPEEFALTLNFIISKLLQNPEFTYVVLKDNEKDSLSRSENSAAELHMEIGTANQRYLLFARINHRSKKHLLTAFQVESGLGNSDSLLVLASRLADKVRDFKQSLISAKTKVTPNARDTIVVKSKPSAITQESYRNALKRSYFTPAVTAKSFFTALSGGYPWQAGFSLKWYFYRNFFCSSGLNWYDQESYGMTSADQTLDLEWNYFPLSAGLGYRIKEFRTYPLVLAELFVNTEQLKCACNNQLTNNQTEISAKALRLAGGLELDFIFKRNIYISASVAYSHFMVYSADAKVSNQDQSRKTEIEQSVKKISKPQPALRLQIGYNFD